MISATKTFLNEINALSEKRKNEILSAKDNLTIKNTTYYVSLDGDDNNDGLTPATAWKTTQKVSSFTLKAGDGVKFRRGDVFRGCIKAQAEVSYGAFGEGAKPRLYGWDYNLADARLWALYDKEHNIYKLNDKILDCGTLVFNDDEFHSYKHIPSYVNGKFVCRNAHHKDFVMQEEMKNDLDIFWRYDEVLTKEPSNGEDFPVPVMNDFSYGELFLRCDKGNPGEVFKSIEAVTRRSGFIVNANKNVKIDNFCIKYVGFHAISGFGDCVEGLTVTNCEIGWIGGTIQNFLGLDPNYVQGVRGEVVRFGNGVEIYGGCKDYTVENCYIYQVYDAGVTHQITTHGKKIGFDNVTYKNNLIEYCVYSIEYFLEMKGGDTESYMNDIKIYGNLLRFAGYGWGQQRHNKHTPAHIKGWSYENVAKNYKVYDNIFDRSAYRMLHLVAKKDEYCPKMSNNTYIQELGKMLGQYGGNETKEPPIEFYDKNVGKKIAEIFKETDAKVYYIEE